jgi:hypothetical protein
LELWPSVMIEKCAPLFNGDTVVIGGALAGGAVIYCFVSTVIFDSETA